MRRSTAVASIATAAASVAMRPLFAQALEKLQVCGTTTEDMTNLFYGIKVGMFTKERLDVELVPTATGAAATTAVIAGTYDIAKTSTLVVFAAYLHDIPIVIVAPELLNEPRRPVPRCSSRAGFDDQDRRRPQRQDDRRYRPQRPQHARDARLGR